MSRNRMMKLSSLYTACFILFGKLSYVAGQEGAQTYLSDADDAACHLACTALVDALPESTHYSSTSLPPGFQDSYYTTQQSSVTPACIVTPPSALVVSSALKIINQHSCHFAVKSGGHALFAGASSSDGGIAIDLKLLNEIEILEGGDVTRVGTGNRWNDVYAKLEPLGKTVVGGRNGDVGVGGFVLGGGISFISRRYGWSCDTVLAFHLVLPNGTITTITPTSSPSLFTALRGGGSNFGIVTSFEMKTYPQDKVWGGSNLYLMTPSSTSAALAAAPPAASKMGGPSLLQTAQTAILQTVFRGMCLFRICTTPLSLSEAFSASLTDGADDPGAQLIFALAWAYEAYIAVVTLVHSEPPAGSLNASSPLPLHPTGEEQGGKAIWRQDKKKNLSPVAFKGFVDLPRVHNTIMVQNFTKVYREVQSFNEAGYRQFWGAVSFHLPAALSTTLTEAILHIWIQEIEPLKHISYVQPSIVFQPIYPEFFTHATENGGNALGLEEQPEKGPLILFSLAFRWSLPTDDAAMHHAGERIYARIAELVTAHGLQRSFIYQNYASPEQDVFGGFGPEGGAAAAAAWRERLREVQRGVDPEGNWRRLKRGGFGL